MLYTLPIPIQRLTKEINYNDLKVVILTEGSYFFYGFDFFLLIEINFPLQNFYK